MIPCRAAAAWRGPVESRRSAAKAATYWERRPCWAAGNSAAAPACHPCWAAASGAAVASAAVPAFVAVPAAAGTASADAASVPLGVPSGPPDATSPVGRRRPRLLGHAARRAPQRERQPAPSRRHKQAIVAFQSPFRRNRVGFLRRCPPPSANHTPVRAHMVPPSSSTTLRRYHFPAGTTTGVAAGFAAAAAPG